MSGNFQVEFSYQSHLNQESEAPKFNRLAIIRHHNCQLCSIEVSSKIKWEAT